MVQNMPRDRTMIEELMEELKDLQKAKDLLETIYSEYGPYGTGTISDDTRQQVNNYFDFDDGE